MAELLTYADVAKKLGVHKGTLCRQIALVNEKNKKKSGQTIKPDKVVVTGTKLSKFYFLPSSVPRIQGLIAKAVAPVGRPKDKK